MSRYYKKLILLLIPACAGFCLALALGSDEEPPQLTHEEMNEEFFYRALRCLDVEDPNDLYNYWDPNYLHYLPAQQWQFTQLTLEEMISWYQPDFYPSGWPWIDIQIKDIFVEDDRVVVFFDRVYTPLEESVFTWYYVLSSEMWILRIADGKIVAGLSVSEPVLAAISQEDRNKALVKKAILAFDEDPFDANLPEQFDPNYVQHVYIGAYEMVGVPAPHFSGAWDWDMVWNPEPVTFKAIIAEGDMVAVHLSWFASWTWDPVGSGTEMAIYRIANGKIVEGWFKTDYVLETGQ